MNSRTPAQTEAPYVPPPEPPRRPDRPTGVSRAAQPGRGPFERDAFSSCTLDEGSSSRTRLALSFGFHLLALILLAGVPIVAVHEIAITKSNHIVVFNEPPPVEEPLPPKIVPRMIAPRRKIEPPLPAPVERTVVLPKPPEPELPPPKHEEPLRPEPVREVPRPVRVVRQALETPIPVAAAPVRRKVLTEVFAETDGVPPAAALPAKSVQTGGFGDPDGTHRDVHSNRPGNLGEIGAFDLSRGPGQGNGTGGASGARGTVASAGFGNGIASGGDSSRGARKGVVNAGGFGDGRAEPEPARPRPKPVESPIVPMEILSKPRPVYTEEARQLRLEGEVVLEVMFGASGNLRVLRVVRGLGHGLDEAAIKAAEMIRFKPARRDNQSVDYMATVRMVFQLA